MSVGDGNERILVIAASAQCRKLIAESVGRVQARIVTSPSISLERVFEVAPETMLVDVDSPPVAAATLRVAKALPGGTGLIVLADSPDSAWVGEALRAGVNAILSREANPEEIRLGILAAEAGLILLHPSSALNLGPSLALEQDTDLPEALTTREQEVLRLASQGLGNKEIAARLNISDHTVKFHISSILGKLGAASRTEAVSQGIRRGFITI
jgi:DNA-binding NarL/FixJ family response regulator